MAWPDYCNTWNTGLLYVASIKIDEKPINLM